MVYLEILIPTYNRPLQITKCLDSVLVSFSLLPKKVRLKVGITIRNNSTKNLDKYQDIVKKYSKKFKKFNLAYFEYFITGRNIGSPNNIWGGFKKIKAEYTWILPDDDIARFDSLDILIKVIKKYKPSFISGGCREKSYIKDYNSNIVINDDKKLNKILDATYNRSKITKFLLSGNTVQLQEYVYKTKFVQTFLRSYKNSSLIHDMLPGVIAIYCLQDKNKPLVRLKKSIGIFRQGNNHLSDWRHLWWKFALIDWPLFSKKMYEKKWLNSKEFKLSKKVYAHILKNLCWRIDILLGLNFKSQINPGLLFKHYGYIYILTILKSPIAIMNELPKRIFNYLK